MPPSTAAKMAAATYLFPMANTYNERGESRREGIPHKTTSSTQPSPPSAVGEKTERRDNEGELGAWPNFSFPTSILPPCCPHGSACRRRDPPRGAARPRRGCRRR